MVSPLPRPTGTDTLCPDPTVFRSQRRAVLARRRAQGQLEGAVRHRLLDVDGGYRRFHCHNRLLPQAKSTTESLANPPGTEPQNRRDAEPESLDRPMMDAFRQWITMFQPFH